MKMAEGIILKMTPRREADAVFEVYTKELGLARFQAKGVRKQEAKLKSGLELFNWAEIYFVPAKYMPIITEIKVKEHFYAIKSNLYRLKLAQAATEVLSKIIELGAAQKGIWREVSSYFSDMNRPETPKNELEQRTYVFYYHLLILNGFSPRFRGNAAAADAWREVRDLFGYHFGIDLKALL